MNSRDGLVQKTNESFCRPMCVSSKPVGRPRKVSLSPVERAFHRRSSAGKIKAELKRRKMAEGKGRRVSFGAGDWSPESMQAILLNIYKNPEKKIA